MSRRILPALLAALLAGPALAHPVPKDNHDRTVVVYLTPSAVLIDYRLEVDEIRALQDLNEAEVSLAGARTRPEVHAAYLRHLAEPLLANLVVRLDGRELGLTCIGQRFALLDHVRCDYRFRADCRLEPGRSYRFDFYEGNFAADSASAIRLSRTNSPQLTLADEVVPADHFRLGDRARRTMSATVRGQPSVETGVVKPGLPPDPDPARPGARGRARRWAATTKPAAGLPAGSVRSSGPDTASAGHPLLDSTGGLIALLLLSAAFGAVHALTPGHGKTMVAAYLVGERGTVWHAVVLGVVTTLTHTGAVLIIAALLLLFPGTAKAAVQAALGLVGGLLIAGLGLWLLLQRLAGQADHVHLGGGHHHHPPEEGPAAKPSWWGLVVLGISGGIIPCWDAITMLILAIGTQRLWLGLPLLLAFSAGLAGVLVVLGVVVVYARKVAQARMGDSQRFHRLIRALPVLSALVITLLGLWLFFESARQAS